MASDNCYYNLNTENCIAMNQIAQEIYRSVRENDIILARLTDLVDTRLKLPNLADKSDNAEAEYSGDYLRSHLDNNLHLDSVEYDETKFAQVKSTRIRQLLIDNYRLLIIKQSKQAENKQLLSIYNSYEQILSETIVPKLTQDVSSLNIERIFAARILCAEHKFPLEDELWGTYCKYLESLESVRVFSNKLIEILVGHLHDEQMERLATQVNILGNLIKQLNGGGLHRNQISNFDYLI
ncbi:hypothetical protein METBIDRAFT_45560 [Metschnikowia bicuspidata var. bicuspidata NRRL YB-4993]|uniref:Uncharacterized protein n=1 Tax=Metschnikowia bicuspidata var. bicuspidata NRRL YB-4993 TaxID=869754 RepID=A0A1A0H7A5_9ASCO|nr:hypothetical protein METBIDRAFT_45560 [Metschnikowia bicuspidata var. bicuspidata NRRL YB-4993]OBA19783.1 hypothetical protein METBIDRAFT_45560 [Metschnikowia bicuspidata var. bicuspidata NRRL YB-4993]